VASGSAANKQQRVSPGRPPDVNGKSTNPRAFGVRRRYFDFVACDDKLPDGLLCRRTASNSSVRARRSAGSPRRYSTFSEVVWRQLNL